MIEIIGWIALTIGVTFFAGAVYVQWQSKRDPYERDML